MWNFFLACIFFKIWEFQIGKKGNLGKLLNQLWLSPLKHLFAIKMSSTYPCHHPLCNQELKLRHCSSVWVRQTHKLWRALAQSFSTWTVHKRRVVCRKWEPWKQRRGTGEGAQPYLRAWPLPNPCMQSEAILQILIFPEIIYINHLLIFVLFFMAFLLKLSQLGFCYL